MDLTDIRPNPKTKKSKKRVGRGHGSGLGKTSGRGQKGQKARYSIARGFEGGQTPLYRRLRKRRGLSKASRNIGIFRRTYAIVNVGALQDHFDPGAEITPEVLLERRIIRKPEDGLRVLGEGELSKALTVRAHHFSAAARAKIEAAGGTAEVI